MDEMYWNRSTPGSAGAGQRTTSLTKPRELAHDSRLYMRT